MKETQIRKKQYNIFSNKKDKKNIKPKEKVEKRNDNTQIKKTKIALTQRDNIEKSKKQSQR